MDLKYGTRRTTLYVLAYLTAVIVISQLKHDTRVPILSVLTISVAISYTFPYVHHLHKLNKYVSRAIYRLGYLASILSLLYMIGLISTSVKPYFRALSIVSVALFIAAITSNYWQKFMTPADMFADADNPILDRYRTMIESDGLVNQFQTDELRALLHNIGRSNAQFMSKTLSGPLDSLWNFRGKFSEEKAEQQRQIMTREVIFSLNDGYALWLAEALQERGSIEPAYLPDLADLAKTWNQRKYVAFSQQPEEVQSLMHAAASDALRRLMQRKDLTILPWRARATMKHVELSWINMGYSLGQFEDSFRTEQAKVAAETMRQKRHKRIVKLLDDIRKNKLNAYLAGTAGYELLLDRGHELDRSTYRFIVFSDDAKNVVKGVKKLGYKIDTVPNSPNILVYANESSDTGASEALGILHPHIFDKKTGRYYAQASENYESRAEYKELDKPQTVTAVGHKILVAPASFYIQDILQNWRTQPETKNAVEESEIDDLLAKYYPELTLESELFALPPQSQDRL